MTAPLYDHELDGLPAGTGTSAGVAPSPNVASKPAPRGKAKGHFAMWVERSSMPELIGWSVSAGMLLSLPLAVAWRPGPIAAAVMAALLLATPVLALSRVSRRWPRAPGASVAKNRKATTSVKSGACVPVGIAATNVAGSRVRIRQDSGNGLRIDILGRPFLDPNMLPFFVVGLLACFGTAGMVLFNGLRGNIPDFHPRYPFVVGPGLLGLAILIGNLLQMFVIESLVVDGEVLVVGYSLFGLRGAKRLNSRYVGPLSYNPVTRRVTVPSTAQPRAKADFGLRLSPEEAESITRAVLAYRLRPPARGAAGGPIRRVDPMRGLGRSSRCVRVRDEGGTYRVRLETPVPGTTALLFLAGLAPIAAAVGVLYTLEKLGVPLRTVPGQLIWTGIGAGYVVAFLGYRVLRQFLGLWLTARTDGNVLELAYECGTCRRRVPGSIWLFLNSPLFCWRRKGARDRGSRRAFRCSDVASIDTLCRYDSADETVRHNYNLRIIRADGSVFDLVEWKVPNATVPKQVILFAQYLRDALRVSGEDRVSS